MSLALWNLFRRHIIVSMRRKSTHPEDYTQSVQFCLESYTQGFTKSLTFRILCVCVCVCVCVCARETERERERESKGFTLAKQMFYHLSHSSVHFALVILEMGSRKLFVGLASNYDPPDLSLPSS
jgi:hypothetical protein